MSTLYDPFRDGELLSPIEQAHADELKGTPLMADVPNIRQYPSGAQRSGDAEATRYDLVSPIGLRRLAETCKDGADKYSDFNWQKGMPVSDVMNHCIRHIFQWLEGDAEEDHLAHAAWNLFAAMHFEETRPELLESVPSRQTVRLG